MDIRVIEVQGFGRYGDAGVGGVQGWAAKGVVVAHGQ